jgi:hypothetical protein
MTKSECRQMSKSLESNKKAMVSCFNEPQDVVRSCDVSWLVRVPQPGVWLDGEILAFLEAHRMSFCKAELASHSMAATLLA